MLGCFMGGGGFQFSRVFICCAALRIFSTGLPGLLVWWQSRTSSRITGPALNTHKQTIMSGIMKNPLICTPVIYTWNTRSMLSATWYFHDINGRFVRVTVITRYFENHWTARGPVHTLGAGTGPEHFQLDPAHRSLVNVKPCLATACPKGKWSWPIIFWALHSIYFVCSLGRRTVEILCFFSGQHIAAIMSWNEYIDRIICACDQHADGVCIIALDGGMKWTSNDHPQVRITLDTSPKDVHFISFLMYFW